MTTSKAGKPAFQSVEMDLIDQRLDAQAAEKGIPTLVVPKVATPETADELNAPGAAKPVTRKASRGPVATVASTPRGRMKTLNIEVPDYTWIAIKMRAAQDMVSVRHVIMLALRADGIEIKDADMIEDGRRLRGNDGV
jgi:hypothetical protein